MKKFKFTLQALLNIEVALEKEKKNELALINAEIARLEEQKVQYGKDMMQAMQYSFRTMDIGDLINTENYTKYLKKCIVDTELEIAVKEDEKNIAQAELIECMRKRKTYERLKEKQFEKYKKEVAVEEAKIIDDYISSSNSGEKTYE